MRKKTADKTVKKRKSRLKLRDVPVRREDLPATQGMLAELTAEIKSEFASLRLEMQAGFKMVDSRFNQMESRFDQVDARFNQMESRFDQIDGRFNQVESRFDQIGGRFNEVGGRFDLVDAKLLTHDSRFKKIEADIHAVKGLTEEQVAQNRAVLEGYDQLYRLNQDHEKRIKDLEP